MYENNESLMTTGPLVSVIIPNYNHARYLKQRLDSVFDQTYQNFEVIILDDCSTDNSMEVIEQYKDNSHLSQIVVNETNSGSPFKQWNKGFQYAKGDLIWIAESDDYCELNFLEELVKAIAAKKNVVLAFSSYVWVDKDGNSFLRSTVRNNQYFNGIDYVRKRMSMECFIHNASGVVFQKQVLKAISDDYLTYKQCGDYMFWIELLEFGNVACVNKNLTFFRIHNGSVTSKNIVSGLVAFEDKKVYDYIDTRFHLSYWQKQIVKAKKHEDYRRMRLESEEIRNEIFNLWGIKKRSGRVDGFLLWFVMSVQRHFGILV